MTRNYTAESWRQYRIEQNQKRWPDVLQTRGNYGWFCQACYECSPCVRFPTEEQLDALQRDHDIHAAHHAMTEQERAAYARTVAGVEALIARGK